MEFFYQNIGHIQRGEWWLWSVTETLEKFSGTYEPSSSGDSARAMEEAVNQVSVLLAYNLHAYAASQNNGIVTSKTIQEVVLGHPYWMRNVGMPAAFFLKRYKSDREGNDLLWRQKFAHAMKARALANLNKVQSDIYDLSHNRIVHVRTPGLHFLVV